VPVPAGGDGTADGPGDRAAPTTAGIGPESRVADGCRGGAGGPRGPRGLARARAVAEPKPVSPSLLSICVLTILLPLVLGAGPGTAATSSASAALALLRTAVDERCSHCGVGRLETIWSADRPSARQLQSVPILDSS